MKTILEKIEESKQAILKKFGKINPKIGIVLGTGLNLISDKINDKKFIKYKDIPHFPQPTTPTHKDILSYGTISNKEVVVIEGRFHFYEGYSLSEVTFPIRIMKALGVDIIIVSNAAGGLNRNFNRGDIMLIKDHINLMGVNPLIGPNFNELGPRYPDMYNVYNKDLLDLACKIALEEKIKFHTGVYIGVTGPNLETAAEYRFFQTIGADAVGMSTVPEVIVAAHSKMKVLGISVITDMCIPDCLQPVNIEEIIKTAEETEPILTKLIHKFIKELNIND